MTEIDERIGQLVGPMIARRLWVCESALASGHTADEVGPYVVEHLEHIIEWERRGVLFVGGPFLDAEGRPGDSAMFVLRADSEADARAIANEEPFHKRGLRSFTIREWQLNEGRISLSIDFSTQRGGLDASPSVPETTRDDQADSLGRKE